MADCHVDDEARGVSPIDGAAVVGGISALLARWRRRIEALRDSSATLSDEERQTLTDAAFLLMLVTNGLDATFSHQFRAQAWLAYLQQTVVEESDAD